MLSLIDWFAHVSFGFIQFDSNIDFVYHRNRRRKQNKTKIARAVDHEADKIEREKEAAKERRATAVTRANEELSLARERKAKSEARSYSNLFEKKGTAEEEDHDWNSRQKEGDFDPEEDFM